MKVFHYILYKTTPSQKWLILFSSWLLFLSGILTTFAGSPGVLQAIRLKSLLDDKSAHLESAKLELQKLQTEIHLLENNRFAQIKEIHRVLGYTASDEIIFDFTHTP